MKFVCVLVLVALPSLSQSEVVELKDGSQIQGKFVKMLNDTLYIEASFGLLRVPKHQVARVTFAGVAPRPPSNPSVSPIDHHSSIPGTLQVRFQEFKLTSTIMVHRGRDRRGHEVANSIETSLFVDGQKVFSVIDSVMDKVIREGPETMLKNQFEPEDFDVIVSPGSYSCLLIIGNTKAANYEDRFGHTLLDKDLLFEEVQIRPGKPTRLRVGVKRTKKGLGSTYLYAVQ